MRPRELVQVLAKEFGTPSDTAVTVDRSLFENGFRQKGKGRNWPDMTRAEAINFMLGCASVTTGLTVATRAAEDVAMWTAARSKLDVTGPIVSEEELAAYGSSHRPNDDERRRILEQRYDRSLKLPFLEGMHGRTVTLVDYLIIAMRHVYMQNDLILTLSPTHHVAEVKINVDQYEWDVEHFRVPKHPRVALDKGFRVDISIPERFLRVIAAHTADPLAEGGDDE